jgi:hypothetical protein
MTKQQRPPPTPKHCVYCGALATSRDHVIPRALFTPPLPQMVTVPACGTCQREKSFGDDDLAHYVALTWEGGQHHQAREQLERVARATIKGHSKIGKAFAKGGSPREVVTAAGIYLFDVWSVPLPDGNRDMFKTLEYIIRGLHVVRNFRWDRNIDRIPNDQLVEVRGVPGQDAISVIGQFLEIPHEPVVVMKNRPIDTEPPIAMWCRTVPVGGDPFSRIWILVFNDQVLFVGVTGGMAVAALEIAAGNASKP